MPASNITSEKIKIELLINGDESAFECLYHQYSERLLGYLLKLVKIESVASELLQDVFIKVWKNRSRIDPDQSFRSYLFRIAENAVCDFFRKAARDKKIQMQLAKIASSNYSHVEEELLTKEDVAYLHSLMGSLPPLRRKVFQLIKLEGRSYAEVSNELNISASTISDHIVKATKFIRQQLENEQSIAFSLIVFSLYYL